MKEGKNKDQNSYSLVLPLMVVDQNFLEALNLLVDPPLFRLHVFLFCCPQASTKLGILFARMDNHVLKNVFAVQLYDGIHLFPEARKYWKKQKCSLYISN